jgi:hypothetical protein
MAHGTLSEHTQRGSMPRVIPRLPCPQHAPLRRPAGGAAALGRTGRVPTWVTSVRKQTIGAVRHCFMAGGQYRTQAQVA